jgi:hypothetical protein
MKTGKITQGLGSGQTAGNGGVALTVQPDSRHNKKRGSPLLGFPCDTNCDCSTSCRYGNTPMTVNPDGKVSAVSDGAWSNG